MLLSTQAQGVVCAHSACVPFATLPLRTRLHGRFRHRAASSLDSRDGNLGFLKATVEVSADESWALQRVSPESFQNRGLYVDPPIVFTSALLLVIMLALSFQRILGLDRLIDQALRDWKEKRLDQERKEIMDARKSLLDSWSDDNQSGGGAGPKVK